MGTGKTQLLASTALPSPPTDEESAVTATEAPPAQPTYDEPPETKPLPARKKKALPQPRAPPVEHVVYTVTDFCTAHRISRWLYYAMKKDGTGPREMRIRDRAFITIEAAAEWRRARERKASPRSIGRRKET